MFGNPGSRRTTGLVNCVRLRSVEDATWFLHTLRPDDGHAGAEAKREGEIGFRLSCRFLSHLPAQNGQPHVFVEGSVGRVRVAGTHGANVGMATLRQGGCFNAW